LLEDRTKSPGEIIGELNAELLDHFPAVRLAEWAELQNRRGETIGDLGRDGVVLLVVGPVSLRSMAGRRKSPADQARPKNRRGRCAALEDILFLD